MGSFELRGSHHKKYQIKVWDTSSISSKFSPKAFSYDPWTSSVHQASFPYHHFPVKVSLSTEIHHNHFPSIAQLSLLKSLILQSQSPQHLHSLSKTFPMYSSLLQQRWQSWMANIISYFGWKPFLHFKRCCFFHITNLMKNITITNSKIAQHEELCPHHNALQTMLKSLIL